MLALLCSFLMQGCNGATIQGDSFSENDISAIRGVTQAYVNGWLQDDTLAILALLDSNAILMPAGLRPVAGIRAIRAFWWPDDGSRTVITDYQMEIEEVAGNDSLAFSRGNGRLSFTYEKNGQATSQSNHTMDLTVYRRQPDGSWRMLRRMWGPLN